MLSFDQKPLFQLYYVNKILVENSCVCPIFSHAWLLLSVCSSCSIIFIFVDSVLATVYISSRTAERHIAVVVTSRTLFFSLLCSSLHSLSHRAHNFPGYAFHATEQRRRRRKKKKYTFWAQTKKYFMHNDQLSSGYYYRCLCHKNRMVLREFEWLNERICQRQVRKEEEEEREKKTESKLKLNLRKNMRLIVITNTAWMKWALPPSMAQVTHMFHLIFHLQMLEICDEKAFITANIW